MHSKLRSHHVNSMSLPAVPGPRLARLGGALAAGAALCLTLASPASAAVPGYERILNISETASSDFTKSTTATCPAGKQVIGTGFTIGSADLNPGFTHVVVDDIRPNASLTSVTVTGYEDAEGTDFRWDVMARAHCADPLPGLERITAVSASDSVSPKSATAVCPAGKQVVGTGAEITGGLGRVMIDDIVPSALLSSVTAKAYEDEFGMSANWTVTAYAICANPLSGLQRIDETSDLVSSSVRVSAPCPSGSVLLSSGAAINNALGRVSLMELGPPNFLTMTNVAGAIEMMSDLTSNWSLSAYSICAIQ